jgi:hypothetical protein
MSEQGQSVNRQIAELLGYKVERTGFANGYGAPVVGFRLISPQRHEVINWEHYNSDLGGYSSSELAWRCVPNYLHSLDASLNELPENFIVEFRAIDNGNILATFCDPKAETSSLWYGEGETRHEAAARALLAWAQRPQKGDG